MRVKKRIKKTLHVFLVLKKYWISFFAIILIMGTITIINYSINNDDFDDAYQDYFNENFTLFKIRVPQNLNFADSAFFY